MKEIIQTGAPSPAYRANYDDIFRKQPETTETLENVTTHSQPSGWIGVDLDGTLARYEGWNGGAIGEPIPLMVNRVKQWILEGRQVRIVTARVAISGEYSDESKQRADVEFAREQVLKIHEWCELHLGKKLAVTCSKDFAMIALYDDRCVQVEPNTGRILDEQRRIE